MLPVRGAKHTNTPQKYLFFQKTTTRINLRNYRYSDKIRGKYHGRAKLLPTRNPEARPFHKATEFPFTTKDRLQSVQLFRKTGV